MPLDRGISFLRIKVRRVDHHHLAPRSHCWRCYILPGLAVVICQLNKAVVGTNPDHLRAQRRRRNRVDDPATLLQRSVRCRGFVEVRWHAGILAGQVLTDLGPVLAAVRRLVKKLIGIIKRVRIGW